MGAALVVYIALVGSAVPWPHKVAIYPTVAKCQAEASAELAKVRRQYVVAQFACIKLPMTPKSP